MRLLRFVLSGLDFDGDVFILLFDNEVDFRFFLEGEPAVGGENPSDFFDIVSMFNGLVPFLGINLVTKLLESLSSFFGEFEELLLVYGDWQNDSFFDEIVLELS